MTSPPLCQPSCMKAAAAVTVTDEPPEKRTPCGHVGLDAPPRVFNVWLSSHIWLFRLESSQLIAARFLDQRQRVSFRPGPVSPQRHVTPSLRVA
ncbi:hypothetical protein EYF80_031126 [Liparis tanakae]|uniref:Uncharacterized protein n=1 Tax=Liparis tanakae TaxID=230148 RepID=A0A4Z2H0M2_9TELE|nr:hypothetical protein EYF80_031126 [Liparis tanakae]